MKIRLNLFTTPDWYQHFIPLFAYTWLKAWPQYGIDVAVMGELDSVTREALTGQDSVKIRVIGDDGEDTEGLVATQNVLDYIPVKDSTANTARYLFLKNLLGLDGIFITDIDFLFFDCGEDIIQWHIKKMKELNTCYYTHHGPWKKPERFPGAWKGEFERLACGAVYLSNEWFVRCAKSLAEYSKQLKSGDIGLYREQDEVILCRICKENLLPINTDKTYPSMLRGIHLGDFRTDMHHRWTNMAKMMVKLTNDNCLKYLEMKQNDTRWQKLCDIVCSGDNKMKLIFDNLHEHLRQRGLM